MLSSIVESDICVADITGRNPNVFYELALAHAMDKHVVIMDGDPERSPFDIQDQRAIKYGLMPDEIEAAIGQLRAKAAHHGEPSEFRDMMNPVATAFRTWTDRQRVESAGDSTEQALLGMMERFEEKLEQVVQKSAPARTSTVSFGDYTVPFSSLIDHGEAILPALNNYWVEGKIPESLKWFIDEGADSLRVAKHFNDSAKLQRWVMYAEELMDQAAAGQPISEERYQFLEATFNKTMYRGSNMKGDIRT
ncbi:hypothetical protein DQ354_12385 [Arthrobacter sp. AQ5-06]|nr:hypothetical protein DQ354_12385 [Arthrobacter sp. AQ5-06]